MMRNSLFIAVAVALCELVAAAEGQTTKRKPPKTPKVQQNEQATIDLAGMEVGQSGHLTFGEGKGKQTLFPLKIGDIEVTPSRFLYQCS